MKRPAKPLEGLGGTLKKHVEPVRSEGELQTILDLAPSVLARSRHESEMAAGIIGPVDDGGRAPLRAHRAGRTYGGKVAHSAAGERLSRVCGIRLIVEGISF